MGNLLAAQISLVDLAGCVFCSAAAQGKGERWNCKDDEGNRARHKATNLCKGMEENHDAFDPFNLLHLFSCT